MGVMARDAMPGQLSLATQAIAARSDIAAEEASASPASGDKAASAAGQVDVASSDTTSDPSTGDASIEKADDARMGFDGSDGAASPSSPVPPGNATLLACLASATIATLASFFALVLGAGWLIGLVTLPLLCLRPAFGLDITFELAVLVALPLVGLLTHDLALQRRGRAGVGLLIALASAALCLAVAMPLARHNSTQLSAAPQAIAAWAQATSQDIRENGLPFGRPQQAGNNEANPQQETGSSQQDGNPTSDGGQASTQREAGSNQQAGNLTSSNNQADAQQEPSPNQQAWSQEADNEQANVPQGTHADQGDSRREDATSEDTSAVPAANGIVSRDNLTQTGQPLLDVTLDRQPIATLYLRQFTGSSYQGGVWTPASAAENEFAAAEAAAMGTDAAALGNLLASAPYEQARQLLGEASRVHVTLRSLASGLDVSSLAPYAGTGERAVAAGLSENPSEEDSSDKAGSTSYIAIPFGTYADVRSAGLLDSPSFAPDDPALQTALADYAAWTPSAYLDVDRTALPRLAQLVEDNPQDSLDAITDTILQTLASGATYTTTPGRFPDDVEIPEHLLFDGHQGYCQHFAAAAVLMYRLYGIPARYVTGYAIPASAFTQQEDGSWRAVASDVRAHAWVEVYTEQLGWVPVEVTPAGSTQAAPYASDPAANAATAGAPTIDEASSQTSKANASSEQRDTQTDESHSVTPDGSEGASESGEDGGDASQSSVGEESEALGKSSGDTARGGTGIPGDGGTGPMGSDESMGVDPSSGSITPSGGDSRSTDASPTSLANTRTTLAGSDGSQQDGLFGDRDVVNGRESFAPGTAASGSSTDTPGTSRAGAENRPGTAGPSQHDSSAGSAESAPTSKTRQQALWVVVGVIAGIAALVGIAVLLRRFVEGRRQRILAERDVAPADVLLSDLLDALRYAGILTGVSGTEADAAERIAHAVPTLAMDDVSHLIAQAQRAAFGPAGANAPAADERCHAAYDQACDHALAALPRTRRFTFLYLHAWR